MMIHALFSRYTGIDNIPQSDNGSKLLGTYSTPEPNANMMFPPRNQGDWTECSNHIEQQVKTIYENLKQELTHRECLRDKDE